MYWKNVWAVEKMLKLVVYWKSTVQYSLVIQPCISICNTVLPSMPNYLGCK